ncbi:MULTISPECIES: hypothetical protein [unclassified Brevundimonas]|uniref:hypothetical protein n=1 Tax=unclassified Brevundimonas TaxID=2622653 RepID=UPI0006FF2EEC|nr:MULTISPECIES: hypothetical protein [unclassified Brevundimonas]KQY93683.1 hypothetical protein ASD25_17420 [Brevundimonas sp. Root1423]KRA28977.1 hypothetical protein ASD59_04005 [Brevundimonas sp. Root608]
MTPTLIVLALVALGVAIVVWATRRKPDSPRVGPQEGDTAWNDPVTPGEPARPIPRADAFADAPPVRDLPRDPQP